MDKSLKWLFIFYAEWKQKRVHSKWHKRWHNRNSLLWMAHELHKRQEIVLFTSQFFALDGRSQQQAFLMEKFWCCCYCCQDDTNCVCTEFHRKKAHILWVFVRFSYLLHLASTHYLSSMALNYVRKKFSITLLPLLKNFSVFSAWDLRKKHLS